MGLVLLTEAQQTQRVITMIIIVLLGAAVVLAGLTFWYWRHTNPRRRVRPLGPDSGLPGGGTLDLRHGYPVQATAPPSRPGGVLGLDDGYDPYRDPKRPEYRGPGYRGADSWTAEPSGAAPRGGEYRPQEYRGQRERSPFEEPTFGDEVPSWQSRQR